MCDPIGSFLLILGDGEGEVSLQEISLVLMINVFPPKAQCLSDVSIVIIIAKYITPRPPV